MGMLLLSKQAQCKQSQPIKYKEVVIIAVLWYHTDIVTYMYSSHSHFRAKGKGNAYACVFRYIPPYWRAAGIVHAPYSQTAQIKSRRKLKLIAEDYTGEKFE